MEEYRSKGGLDERNNYVERKKNTRYAFQFLYINILYLNLTKSDSRCRIPSDSYSNPQNFLSNFDRFESSFPSSFHSFFFSFFFLHTINKFHSVKKRSRNVEVNVSLSLSPSFPFLSLPPPRFYFNCRLLGRDEPAHVALRGKQAAAKERARSIGHGSEIVSGRLCVPLDRQSNSTDGTRLVDWCCAFGNARPAI